MTGWTIHITDGARGIFIVRRWRIGTAGELECVDAEQYIGDDLAAARAVVDPGAYRTERDSDDPDDIIETWLLARSDVRPD